MIIVSKTKYRLRLINDTVNKNENKVLPKENKQSMKLKSII